MKATYLYCYTRTKYIDYRHVFGLSYTSCPEDVQHVFTQRIRAILNQTDDSNLSTPVYVFFRENNYVLYGIVCLNNVLSTEYCNEKTNGRVRGFIGIVTDTSHECVNSIPTSLDFYKALYKQHIVPVWESYTFQYENDKNIDINDFHFEKRVIASKTTSSINTDRCHCRLFSNTWDGDSLISEALGADTNVSVALYVDNERQVNMPEYYPLMNAQMKHAIEGSYEDIEIQYRCIQCGALVNELYKENTCYKCWSDKNTTKPEFEVSAESDTQTVDNNLCDIHCTSTEENAQPKYTCSKCGCKTEELYTKHKLCNNCYADYAKRQKIKNILFPTLGTIFLLLVFLLWIKSSRNIKTPCFMRGTDSTLVAQDSIEHDSISNKLNHINDSLIN